MFRRKSKKGIELVSVAKRNESEKSAPPKTSNEVKAKRRAIRSMSFIHSSKKTEHLQPLEDKRASRKISEPVLSNKTETKFVSPVHQPSKLMLSNGDEDGEEQTPTRVYTSRFTMKIVPNGMSHMPTNGRANYRHSTYIPGSVPTLHQLTKSKNIEQKIINEELELEEEAVQTMSFDDDPSDEKSNSLPRNRTSTNKSVFDLSYEL